MLCCGQLAPTGQLAGNRLAASPVLATTLFGEPLVSQHSQAPPVLAPQELQTLVADILEGLVHLKVSTNLTTSLLQRMPFVHL